MKSIGRKGKKEKITQSDPMSDLSRPYPPDEIIDPESFQSMYLPAPDVSAWLKEVFLNEDSPLYNEDHRHLVEADIYVLWTNDGWTRQMNRVAAQAEIVMIRASAWQKGRQEQQMREWFGCVPQYLITIDAHYAAGASDAQWCSLVEHELYHFGQDHDAFGAPIFKQDGSPKISMRGHDVEEFIGIVRRYGAGNGAGATAKLVEASRKAPEIARADIACICGTCQLKAA